MRAVLEMRKKAVVVLVEELEAELERVRAALADAEEVLRRRVIGLEQYVEALAEADAPVVGAHQHAAATGREGGDTGRTNRSITPSADPGAD
jgi:NADH dehydrogenase/NADH:ubiquinone oxidoreductase subunit G